jgi:DNA-binding response OmpR family regulator
MTVVLLELDPLFRRIEVAALRYGGYDVATARSVEQAVTLVRARRAGAILVDPARSDAALIVERLRARTDLPIFVVSEVGESLVVVAALDAGADDYVVKPFRVEELLARIRASVRRARTAEAAIPLGGYSGAMVPRSFSPESSSACSKFSCVTLATSSHASRYSRRSGGPGAERVPITCGYSSPGSDGSWNPIRPIRGIC